MASAAPGSCPWQKHEDVLIVLLIAAWTKGGMQ